MKPVLSYRTLAGFRRCDHCERLVNPENQMQLPWEARSLVCPACFRANVTDDDLKEEGKKK